LPAYAQGVLAALLGDVPVSDAQAQSVRINGLPAYVLQASVATERGPVIVSLAAYGTSGPAAYHFAMVSKPQTEPQVAIAELFRSFRALTPAEAATLRPRVIDVVAARRGDTLRSLATRTASERPLEHLATLNARRPGDPLRPGELIKLVVWR
jgi:predicted Zn-dependent protease